MPDKPKSKPKKKGKRGRKEERLVITGDPEKAFRKLLEPKPTKKKPSV